ncbi:hypothetical protein MMC30_002454 [Trapelia coarctata]|nr:hypothetical protein [Trapelia coarctata]
MADVRSLLRNERASRRVTHPHAAYSTTGNLSCSICHVPLKSESLWGTHLKSAQHISNLEKLRAATTNGSLRSRKRRADDDEDEDMRKRAKPTNGLPEGFFDNGSNVVEDDVGAEVTEDTTAAAPPTITETVTLEPQSLPIQPNPNSGVPPGFFDPSAKGAPTPPTAQPTIDEGEWAAFERDIATTPPETSAVAALTAAATITAAPLTAAEIAAKSREEASIQTKERREAEVEGEKEDAARRLEEEFDDMEELEERVRRLREKREEIRRRSEEALISGVDGDRAMIGVVETGGRVGLDEMEESEDDEDEEDDGWDTWGMR